MLRPGNGVVKDHQHRAAGAFDGLPATGMFALATAAAWRMGMVERPFAEQTLRQVHRPSREMPRAGGLLPHFVERPKADGRRPHGPFRMFPGTEYSTVDTSLYFHGMLLAAQMLGDAATKASCSAEVRAIRFDQFRDPEGHDPARRCGRTGRRRSAGRGATGAARRPWSCCWSGSPNGRTPAPRMNRTGKVPGGIGFIGEVQSLFYPQFNADARTP